MKYIVIIGDGMADFPIEDLGGKTPLMAAQKPCMDMMAREGFCGKVNTIPEGFPPGSDVAGMSIFGYDPARFYTGRAPIEAYGMGIEMDDDDVAFRCNLVNLDMRPEKIIMVDYSGGHITTEEAQALIKDIGEALGGGDFRFFPGVAYRHLMFWKGGSFDMRTTPPHDITDKDIFPYIPEGNGAGAIIDLMKRSQALLKDHPINMKRVAGNKLPANSIWLWGQGKKSWLPRFSTKHGLRGATVAAVDLIKGISNMIGFDTPHVEGATGYVDTDYGAKARKALKLLHDHDIVFIHIEAPDEASHNGNLKDKIRAIENIDEKVVRFLFQEVDEGSKFMIITDHATPIATRTHHACPVPFTIFEKGGKVVSAPSFAEGYDERSGERLFTGEELISFFIGGQMP